jgi:hypothetical protein
VQVVLAQRIQLLLGPVGLILYSPRLLQLVVEVVEAKAALTESQAVLVEAALGLVLELVELAVKETLEAMET